MLTSGRETPNRRKDEKENPFGFTETETKKFAVVANEIAVSSRPEKLLRSVNQLSNGCATKKASKWSKLLHCQTLSTGARDKIEQSGDFCAALVIPLRSVTLQERKFPSDFKPAGLANKTIRISGIVQIRDEPPCYLELGGETPRGLDEHGSILINLLETRYGTL